MQISNPYPATFPVGVRTVCAALLCIGCFCTLFVTSRQFVNPQVTPKWFGLALCAGLAGLFYVCCNRKRFDNQNIDFQYIAGIFACFALALSIHGILQYFGMMASENSKFPVTGSFDNPAGYAAALACMLPFCFLFINDKHPYLHYAAVAAVVLVLTALVLSGSRAGVLAGIVVLPVYLSVSYVTKKWLKIALICTILALPAILYLFGENSADGRLLIWRCTWNMICDAPLAGHGQGAFQAKYMLYQADYFTAHPDSKYTALADNVLHPFNEYLSVFAEHGLPGLGFLALLGVLLLRSYRKERSDAKRIALLSLLALAVFSCFSYPFKYPFTWFIAFLNIAVIFHSTRIYQNTKPLNIITKTAVAIAVCGIFFTAIPLMKAEMKWNETAHQSLAGKTREVLPEYDKLYRYLGKNGLFLYNHAAELHEIKEYEQSLAVFSLCTVYYNDMDVQMLLADNYKGLHQYEKAEQHLKLAVAMCPARFMPLYELAELYGETGRKAEAVALARQIADKEVKIPSATIFAIKQKMRQLIEKSEAEEINVPVQESRTSYQPQTTEPWQDNISEKPSLETVLPP